MNIIEKPIITEKMTAKAEKLGQYGFIVHKEANKIQIKNEVEKLYQVSVISVNTMNYQGKTKTRNTKKGSFIRGRKPSLKKAVVTVEKGEVIDFYSNV